MVYSKSRTRQSLQNQNPCCMEEACGLRTRYDKTFLKRYANDPIYRAQKQLENPEPLPRTFLFVSLQSGSFQPLLQTSDAHG
jgi:hypothetical protein